MANALGTGAAAHLDMEAQLARLDLVASDKDQVCPQCDEALGPAEGCLECLPLMAWVKPVRSEIVISNFEPGYPPRARRIAFEWIDTLYHQDRVPRGMQKELTLKCVAAPWLHSILYEVYIKTYPKVWPNKGTDIIVRLPNWMSNSKYDRQSDLAGRARLPGRPKKGFAGYREAPRPVPTRLASHKTSNRPLIYRTGPQVSDAKEFAGTPEKPGRKICKK